MARQIALAGMLLAVLGLYGRVAVALDIVLDFRDDLQQETMPFDDAGARLTAIFQAAEAIYEDIIEDDYTLQIDFWYTDLDKGVLGNHNLISQSGGRETRGSVRIDSRSGEGGTGAFNNYFFDLTPFDNSEFNMQQTLWRDLTVDQQADWYFPYNSSNNIPETLEVGFAGLANGTDTDAANNVDMLTLVLHEVGHALGMDGRNDTTAAEAKDGDYDVNPSFVFGETLSIDNADQLTDTVGHLDGEPMLMFPSLRLPPGTNSLGTRKLPSHTDLYAMAAGNNLEELDLPRRELYGGTYWDDSSNWSGNTFPSALDDVFVRNPGVPNDVHLDSGESAKHLTVAEGASLNAENYQLAVDVLTVTDADTVASMEVGGQIVGQWMEIRDGGALRPNGGEVLAGQIVLDGGILAGNGLITVGGKWPDINESFLLNDGFIQPSGGALTLEAYTSSETLDLDGDSESGEVHADDGDLVVDGQLTDAFDDLMTIGAGHSITVLESWTLGSDSFFNMNGGDTNAEQATLDGEDVTIAGRMDVTGRARINSSAVMLNLPEYMDIKPGGRLNINSPVTWSSGDVIGSGTLRFNDDVTVIGRVAIFPRLDLDGTGAEDNVITITSDARLEINAGDVETADDDGFDGVFDIYGTLDVIPNWRLDGVMNLYGTMNDPAEVYSPNLMTVHDSGQVNVHDVAIVYGQVLVDGNLWVDGSARFEADSAFNPSAAVFVNNADDVLDLRGHTQYVGASFGGSGMIRQTGDAVVITDTTMGVAVYDPDGSWQPNVITILPNVTFSVTSGQIGQDENDAFSGTFEIDSGVLDVSNAWSVDGQVNLNHTSEFRPELAGGYETHSAGVTFEKDGLLRADGDSLVSAPITVLGSVDVVDGELEIANTTTFEASSLVSPWGGARLLLNGPTTFNGGLFSGLGGISQTGDADFNAPVSMYLTYYDMDGDIGNSSITLADSAVTLNVDRVDAINNVYTGSLNMNGNDAGLTVNLGTPGDRWTMSGLVEINAGVGDIATSLSGSPVDVPGRILVAGRTRFTADINVINEIHLETPKTRLHLESGGEDTFRASSNVWGPGGVRVEPGTQLNLDNGVLVNAMIRNSGRLEPDDPADSIGLATVNAEYIQDETGVLGIELGGPIFGTFYDQLRVLGPATIDGRLDLELVNGYFPMPYGVAHTVLSAAGTVEGVFSAVDGVVLDDMYGLAVTYSPFTVDVTAALLGDANLDGTVDGLDLSAWKEHYGQTGTWIDGDFSGNGIVEGLDFLVLQRQWGSVVSSVSAAAGVPEPPTAMLAAVILLPAAVRNYRERSRSR